MYQRVEKQEKFTEETLDCGTMKQEFQQSVKADSTHKNEDSAKKLAVAQGSLSTTKLGMDYDGFHQMVLGANLKAVKKGEIMSTKSQSRPLNLVASGKSADTAPIPLIGIKLTEEQKDVEPRNQEEFDKHLNKKCMDDGDKYR